MIKPPTTKSSESIADRPHRYFYMVAVRETLERGDRAEMQSLIASIKEVQQHYGGIDGVIKELEGRAG